MAKNQYLVAVEGEILMDIDDAVINRGLSEESAYHFSSPEEVAAHLAYNFVMNGASLSQLDGWADMDDDLVEVIEDAIDFA